MFYRQLSLLVVTILLLSPNLVRAQEIEPGSQLSVGNIFIQTNDYGTFIYTPQIQISTPKSIENTRSTRWDRHRRSTSVNNRRGKFTPSSVTKKTNSDSYTTVTTSTYPGNGSTIRSTTIRRSDRNGSQSSVSEQRQSIQCSGENSSVSQSTSTVNGRTVSARTWTNCD
jgi:hypothetical protein